MKFAQAGFAHILILILLLVGLVATVYLVGQRTNLFSRASSQSVVFKSSSGGALPEKTGIPQSTSTKVKVVLTSFLGPAGISPTPTSTFCDANQDGKINEKDRFLIMGCSNQLAKGECAKIDINKDGKINQTDMDKYFYGCPQLFSGKPTNLPQKGGGGTNPVTTVSFRIAGNPNDFSNSKIQPYTADPTIIDYDLGDPKPGMKFIWVEFKDSNGKTDKRPGQIEIINLPTPTPTPTPSTNRVFITSTVYNGNLGGLAGADAKCQERANVVNLSGNWKAWISDSTISASSRLNHYDVPYALINGTKIADNWSDLTDGTIQNPINITDLGVIKNDYVWTNSFPSGIPLSDTNPCLNWTSENATSYQQVGGSSRTDKSWTFNATFVSCSKPQSLYCFEQTLTAPTPTVTPTPTITPIPLPEKRVFVSSTSVWGNLGGLAGADIKCQTDANNSRLGGTWKAWLSTSTTSVASRFVHNEGPYKLINGTLIANSWDDLTDGSLHNPINKDSGGRSVSGTVIWTNTLPNGQSGSVDEDINYPGPGGQINEAEPRYSSCDEWISRSATSGNTGGTYFKDTQWTRWGSSGCSGTGYERLYCFEQ